ncbi:hypothetical protein ACPPVO_55235 [Dactylosporangium sp. McL0621]|uniref:hypothetical protein n=1 Tax=Dactylosporangium sp. McL0621 TaxID=3415678 RepID=UPI003CF7D758
MRRRLIAAAATAMAAFAVAIPASAALNQPSQVSTNPADFTPNVLDGEVRAFALVGDTVVVGGDFTSVTDAQRKVKYNRKNLFAYRAATGEILPFAPQPDAPVFTLATGASNTVYAGGEFKKIAGADQRGLAQLNVADDSRVPAFTAAINWGDSRSIIAQGPYLYVAGSFSAIGATGRVGLARLDATTGAVDPVFDLKLAAPHLTRVKLEDLALTPDGHPAGRGRRGGAGRRAVAGPGGDGRHPGRRAGAPRRLVHRRLRPRVPGRLRDVPARRRLRPDRHLRDDRGDGPQVGRRPDV